MTDETKRPPDDYQPKANFGPKHERPPRKGEPGFEEHLAQMYAVLEAHRRKRPVMSDEDESASKIPPL
jgi:hypothetical protein